MFGTSLRDRRSRPERIANQAWEHLVAAVNSTGDTVRHATRDTARSARRTTAHLADGATDRANAAAGEARERASRAYDALAGRRPSRSWGWLAGAGLAGIALGWAVGMAAVRARRHAETAEITSGSAPVTGAATGDGRSTRDDDPRDLEFVDMDRPTQPISRDF